MFGWVSLSTPTPAEEQCVPALPATVFKTTLSCRVLARILLSSLGDASSPSQPDPAQHYIHRQWHHVLARHTHSCTRTQTISSSKPLCIFATTCGIYQYNPHCQLSQCNWVYLYATTPATPTMPTTSTLATTFRTKRIGGRLLSISTRHFSNLRSKPIQIHK